MFAKNKVIIIQERFNLHRNLLHYYSNYQIARSFKIHIFSINCNLLLSIFVDVILQLQQSIRKMKTH